MSVHTATPFLATSSIAFEEDDIWEKQPPKNKTSRFSFLARFFRKFSKPNSSRKLSTDSKYIYKLPGAPNCVTYDDDGIHSPYKSEDEDSHGIDHSIRPLETREKIKLSLPFSKETSRHRSLTFPSDDNTSFPLEHLAQKAHDCFRQSAAKAPPPSTKDFSLALVPNPIHRPTTPPPLRTLDTQSSFPTLSTRWFCARIQKRLIETELESLCCELVQTYPTLRTYTESFTLYLSSWYTGCEAVRSGKCSLPRTLSLKNKTITTANIGIALTGFLELIPCVGSFLHSISAMGLETLKYKLEKLRNTKLLLVLGADRTEAIKKIKRMAILLAVNAYHKHIQDHDPAMRLLNNLDLKDKRQHKRLLSKLKRSGYIPKICFNPRKWAEQDAHFVIDFIDSKVKGTHRPTSMEMAKEVVTHRSKRKKDSIDLSFEDKIPLFIENHYKDRQHLILPSETLFLKDDPLHNYLEGVKDTSDEPHSTLCIEELPDS